MPRGGPRSTSFRPGVSGNPGGRPKKAATVEARKAIADLRVLARSVAPDAIQALVDVMSNPKSPPAARVRAATAILDRGYGRPGQEVKVSAETAFASYDLTRLSDQELAEMMRILSIAKRSELEGPLLLP